ncbi:MAG: hypothetical protein K0Q78_2124, partial [Cellvibrio sp.]|nr:hypothetical protein [Cellvibrio sp.]
PADMEELANALLTGNARLNQLQLGNPEWQTLVAALLGKKFSAATAAINHFIAAVQSSLSAAPQPVESYPALIARLMTIASLDIEAITTALKLQARQVTWQTVSATPELLARMVRSYSELFPDHSPTGHTQLVEARAAVIDNKIPFYQQVLDALFNRMSFDPDQSGREWAINNIEPGINDINAGEKAGELAPFHRTAINSNAALETLARELLAGKILPAQVELTQSTWPHLIAAVTTQKHSVSATTINSLVSVLSEPLADQSAAVKHYRDMLARIISLDALDIEALVAGMKLQRRFLAWPTVVENPAFLRRILLETIKFSNKLTTENHRKLVIALDTPITNIPTSSALYKQLLNQLFSDDAIAIEQFCNPLAHQVSANAIAPQAEQLENNKQISVAPVNDVNKTVQDSVNSRDSITERNPLNTKDQSTTSAAEHNNFPAIDGAGADTAVIANSDKIYPVETIPGLVQQLLAGKTSPSALELSSYDWQQLIAVLLQLKYSASTDEINSFIAAIQYSHHGSTDAVASFGLLATRLLALEKLDTEAIVTAFKLQARRLAWQGIATTSEFLQRVLHSYIKLDSKIAIDDQGDLIAAIEFQAKTSAYPGEFYQQVLDRLFNNNALDFEEVHHFLEKRKNDSAAHLSPSAKPEITNTKIARPDAEKQHSSTGAVNSAEQFLMLANSLVTQHVSLTDLVTRTSAFSDSDWSQLLSCLFHATQTAVMASELQQAITQFAAQARNRSNYYLYIVAAILTERSIDLEAFAALDNTSPAMDQPTQPQSLGEATGTVKNSAEQNRQQGKQYPVPQNELQETMHQHDRREPDLMEANSPEDSLPEQFIQPQLPVTGATQKPIAFASDNQDLPSEKNLLAHLLAQDNPEREQLLLLQQKLNQLLHKTTASLTTEWLQVLANPNFCLRLIRAVPGHLLQQLCNHLQPHLFGPLDPLVKLVSDALQLLMPHLDQLKLKQAKWEFIFQQLFAGNTPVSDRAQLTHECCLYLATHTRCDDPDALVQLAQRRLVLLIPVAQLKPAMSLKDLGLETTDSNTDENRAVGLVINNAGQVLAAPFLTRLFSMLNLTHEGKFIHLAAAERAAHLVQFIVNGQMETPEYELPLNKILCGISTSFPLSSGIIVTEQEQTLIEQMLTSMIQHWSVLGSTSIAGLRETFFQRQGWLVLEEDCWRLTVQEGSFDMLLDHLPWSIALIKHGWMDKPLRVSWRNQS